jgi:DNA (cytosine-5)-methyltransferase 1
MGLELAGFKHLGLIEWDHDSCETLRENQRLGHDLIKDWPIHEADARKFDYRGIKERVNLVAGGPPCQPFSLAGKGGSFNDGRDMWGEAVRAVRELAPDAFIFENVKGLLRPAFADYFSYIRLQLAYPNDKRKKDEGWECHYQRLQKRQPKSLEYEVRYKLLNAANFGVPQKRERVVIVGFRKGLGSGWNYPAASHAQAPASKDIKPWVSVKAALSGLPDLPAKRKAAVTNHAFQDGARFYAGHTGSKLTEPAKTLKAGAHGVPGGENMLVRDDGTCRYFSVREAARIQTFPDDFIFPVAWSESMRQLGNAVPVRLAQIIGESVAAELKK